MASIQQSTENLIVCILSIKQKVVGSTGKRDSESIAFEKNSNRDLGERMHGVTPYP